MYEVLKALIEKGKTANMARKINVFYASDDITEAQRTELLAMLGA